VGESPVRGDVDIALLAQPELPEVSLTSWGELNIPLVREPLGGVAMVRPLLPLVTKPAEVSTVPSLRLRIAGLVAFRRAIAEWPNLG
jgi:hypothetical protein